MYITWKINEVLENMYCPFSDTHLSAYADMHLTADKFKQTPWFWNYVVYANIVISRDTTNTYDREHIMIEPNSMYSIERVKKNGYKKIEYYPPWK